VSVKSGGVTAAEAGFSCRNNSEIHPVNRPTTTVSKTRWSVLKEAAVVAEATLTFVSSPK
jgi:hypothetical protein